MFGWTVTAVAVCSVLLTVPMAAGTGSGTSCEEARLKCAYRTGCGMALNNYMLGCSGVVQRASGASHCPEVCQHALIALTSAEEGKELISCKCTDDMCKQAKERVEICRPHVELATLNETIVSCRVAQWICKADALCSTALDYYHRFCRSMFQGKRCTNRCNNSISILRRQEKAAKLVACRCDGQEDYDCPQIRINMERLCFPPASSPASPSSTAAPTSGTVGSAVTTSTLVLMSTALGILLQAT
ncbi:growth arrest-specific protein 1 [Anabrus simplex]|uniref:growth arrest-specific protein 1 n=1 Tax=Anabrus simplex TaxID=316456 RepID=UPI0034DCE2DE